MRRTNGQLELTKLLNDVLQRTQEQIKPFDSTETQHMAVQKSRVEMFEIYDELKQKRCREESTKKGKDKAIRDAAKILAEHIVQLDELDMHNGCFTNEIVFPSVVYEWRESMWLYNSNRVFHLLL